MNKYRIADLNVLMDPKSDPLLTQSKSYLWDFEGDPDITIDLGRDYFVEKQKQAPALTVDECEYLWTGADFYEKLLDFDGMFLHASCVALDGKAYLFSAPCGTGKSTHTGLWQEYFGKEKALIINDDKPAMRLIYDKFYAYGTPFSGKTDKNLNMKVPVKAICFIEQSPENSIWQISSVEALLLILNQTIRPYREEGMEKLLFIIDKLLKKVPIYKLACNMSHEAVETAFREMSK